jgi:hypothetical protein
MSLAAKTGFIEFKGWCPFKKNKKYQRSHWSKPTKIKKIHQTVNDRGTEKGCHVLRGKVKKGLLLLCDLPQKILLKKNTYKSGKNWEA